MRRAYLIDEKMSEHERCVLEEASRQVGKNGRLETDTERELGRLAVRAGEQRRESLRDEILLLLFRANSGIPKAYAQRFCKRYGETIEDDEEIFSAADEGLWVALQRYDGRNRVSSYAVHWIRQRMQRSVTKEASESSRIQIAKINAGVEKEPDPRSSEGRRLAVARQFVVPPIPLPRGVASEDDPDGVGSWEKGSRSAFEGEELAGRSAEEECELKEMLDFIESKLDSLQRVLVTECAMGGEKIATVARRERVSPRRARLAYAEALARLRSEFGLEKKKDLRARG